MEQVINVELLINQIRKAAEVKEAARLSREREATKKAALARAKAATQKARQEERIHQKNDMLFQVEFATPEELESELETRAAAVKAAFAPEEDLNRKEKKLEAAEVLVSKAEDQLIQCHAAVVAAKELRADIQREQQKALDELHKGVEDLNGLLPVEELNAMVEKAETQIKGAFSEFLLPAERRLHKAERAEKAATYAADRAHFQKKCAQSFLMETLRPKEVGYGSQSTKVTLGQLLKGVKA